MEHREQDGELNPSEESTFPVDQRRLAEASHHGQGGIEGRYRQARAGFERGFSAKRAAATDEWGRARTFEQAEPNYRAGFLAGNDLRYEGQEFAAIEPELRREYESSTAARRGGDLWARLRDEIHAGFREARARLHDPRRD